MKRKSFTVVETLVAIVVLALLSSLSVVTWSSMVDKAKQEVCGQQQLMLIEALKLYIADNDDVPVSLSQLAPEYTDMALAALKKERPLVYLKHKIYLALFRINEPKTAWAKQPPFKNYVGLHSGILRCPANDEGGISYGFNGRLDNPTGQNTAMDEFKNLVFNSMPIMCDSDSPTFNSNASGDITSGVKFRHKQRKFLEVKDVAVAVGGKGTAEVISASKNWTNPEKILKGPKGGSGDDYGGDDYGGDDYGGGDYGGGDYSGGTYGGGSY